MPKDLAPLEEAMAVRNRLAHGDLDREAPGEGVSVLLDRVDSLLTDAAA